MKQTFRIRGKFVTRSERRADGAIAGREESAGFRLKRCGDSRPRSAQFRFDSRLPGNKLIRIKQIDAYVEVTPRSPSKH